MCGDMINVVIPSNKPIPTGAKGGEEVNDPLLSGRYLITSLRHQVTPSEAIHTMTMTVMKDSVERATPVMEVNYPEPPQGQVKVTEKVESKKLEPQTKKPTPINRPPLIPVWEMDK